MSGVDAYFVDSNLLLYYVDPVDSRKRLNAAAWLNHLWLTGTGRLSWQVLHEFYWNAVWKMQLKPSNARRIVEDLAQWKPVGASLGLVQQAWRWMDSAQVPYWDALILAAAERSGARYLLSEDFQPNRRFGGLQVLDPFTNAPSGSPPASASSV
jgi:predicted nucleic acid-binding protein